MANSQALLSFFAAVVVATGTAGLPQSQTCLYNDATSNCNENVQSSTGVLYPAWFTSAVQCANTTTLQQQYMVGLCPATCLCKFAAAAPAETVVQQVPVPAPAPVEAVPEVAVESGPRRSKKRRTTTPSPETADNVAAEQIARRVGTDTRDLGVQKAIADLHNEKRKLVSSVDMLRLSWDADLAQLAQSWADQCTNGHPSKAQSQYWVTPKFKKTGQNVAAGFATWKEAINGWYSEINDFAFGIGSNSQAQVGHYTQLVWNGTFAIGCGFKQCNMGAFYVCQYGPAGNMGTGKYYPYLAGTPCQNCPNNCDDGLCTNPCAFVNEYENCEKSVANFDALFPRGCTGEYKEFEPHCDATCNCFGQKIYRL